MSDRVLSTPAAREAIVKFGNIVKGDLENQVKALDREGKTLSDPNNWDGRLAGEFRAKWVQINATLLKMVASLEELKGDVQQINANIMEAGGN